MGDYRLLEASPRLVLPSGVFVRFCLRSADVIHSWALYGASVKVDCVPGILNSVVVYFPYLGVYYGQCREICGANHSFMPITVEVTCWDFFFF